MSQTYNNLKNAVAAIEEDIERFYEKENKSAGVRIRKAMQDIKSLAQEIRKEIVEKRK